MNPLRPFFRRLCAIFCKRKFERDMEEEMRFHLDERAAERLADGLPPEEARLAAKRKFGNLVLIQETAREGRAWTGLENLMRDLRFALRSLAKTPAFFAIAVLILALGIAGNTIIFSLVSGLYLKPLPFPEPGRLVDLNETAPKWNLVYTSVKYADFDAWRMHNQTFSAMAVWRSASFNLTVDRRSERVSGQQVSLDLAEVFGLQPLLGRIFTSTEELTGAPTVALIGHRLWKEMFAGDPAVLGKMIMLDGEPYEIVGVLPASAAFPSPAAVWIPFKSKPGAWCLSGIGRLKPGITVKQAADDLLRIHRNRIPEAKENEITSPTVLPLLDRYLGDGTIIAILLQAGVVVMLMIACANVAGMMMARNLARVPELGLRAAIGASRWQLARHLLAESLLLAIIGGVAGACLGRWLLSRHLAWLITEMPAWIRIEMDAGFIAYVIGLVVFCAVVAGLMPARQVLGHVDLRSVIGQGAQQSSASHGRIHALRLLIVSEVAFSLLLLMVAGFLGRAFLRVQHTDPGIQAQNLLTYGISLPEARYRSKDAQLGFCRQHLERIRKLPGVVSASLCTVLPFSGAHEGNFFSADSGRFATADVQPPVVLTRLCMEDYFQTMGISFVAGRSYGEGDGPGVIIINETLARIYWPGEKALGKHLRFRGNATPWLEVIGIARDVRHYGLEGDVRPGVYLPYRMDPKLNFGIAVRTIAEPASLAPAIRTVVREQDATLAIAGPSTMEGLIRQSLFLRRMYSGMLASFALISLTLAAAGLYGIVSYVVSQRTHEFGIRLALGAQVGELMRLVLGDGIRLAAIGIAIGAVGGVLAGCALSGLLVSVSPLDPIVLLCMIALLGSIVLLACFVPARRAMRLNVVEVLRAE